MVMLCPVNLADTKAIADKQVAAGIP